MHVVIVGCGRVGSSLANQLSQAQHSVSVVDRRSEAFNRLDSDFNGATVTGVGFDRDVLVSAGIERADALAAVTSGDNSNILVAWVARERFGVTKVVARIYDQRRAAIYERLGISTIATVAWTTQRVLRRIEGVDIRDVWMDPSATYSMTERVVEPAAAGTSVLAYQNERGERLALLTRLGTAQLPSDDTVLQEGDVVHVVTRGGGL